MTRCRTRLQGGLAMVTAAVVMAGSCTRAPAEPQGSDLRSEVARLQRTTAVRQRQLDLAAGKDFYLVCNPAAADLTLMLRGAVLQRYPVLGMRVGRPMVAWVGLRAARPWQGVVWTAGTLDPLRQIDRLVVEAAEPGTAEGEPEPPPIPPTPEELYPVPSRYLIRFADGLSVEIRPREADQNLGRWGRLRAWSSAKWHDVGAALFHSDRDAVRLRLVLRPQDAASLYRSLPPDVRLIVL